MAAGRGVVKGSRSLSQLPQTAGLLPPDLAGFRFRLYFKAAADSLAPLVIRLACRRAGAMVRGRHLVAALIRAGWSVPLLVAGTSAGVRRATPPQPAGAPAAGAAITLPH